MLILSVPLPSQERIDDITSTPISLKLHSVLYPANPRYLHLNDIFLLEKLRRFHEQTYASGGPCHN